MTAIASAVRSLAARERARRLIDGLRIWLPLSWLVLIAALAISIDWLPIPSPTHMNFMHMEALPGWPHVLGTDHTGRDMLSRIGHGARVSLVVGFGAPLIGLFVGTAMGLLSAFYGGYVRTVILTVMDSILAFPGLVLAMALTAVMGPSVQSVTIALGFLSIPAFARIARANALPLLQREFVLAARTAGAGDVYILVREVLPNMAMALLTYGLMIVSVMIVIEGSLSFLGVGIQPPQPTWGGMIAEGREALERSPHVTLIPAAVMFLTVLSLNLLGDSLRKKTEAKEGGLS